MRGFLKKKDFFELRKRLEMDCVSFEIDHKVSYFFAVSGFILKINDEEAKKTAKIVMKLGHETGSVFEEIEVNMMSKDDIEKVLKIFSALGINEVNKVPQLRYNYFFTNSVTISLKHTPDFKYHFEVEGVANSSKIVGTIKRRLMELCGKYGLRYLSEAEMANVINRINTKRGFSHKYSIYEKNDNGNEKRIGRYIKQ